MALAVTASVMFGRLFVAPLLFDFLAQHPKVSGRALLVDRVVDLIEEGLDVAVRIQRLRDASFSAIRVGSVREVVVAAPSYLKRHGTPRRPKDLAECTAISFSGDRAAPAWSFEVGKQLVSVCPNARLVVTARRWRCRVSPTAPASRARFRTCSPRDVKAGRLKVILSEFEPDPIPIHVIHREGRRAATRVRAFVDFVVAELRANALLK